MSDASNQTMTGNAKEIQLCAADWLARRDKGGWSEEEQAALDAWLGESWAHTIAYWRLDAAWKRTDRLDALRQQKIISAASRAFPWPLLLRTAAVLGIVAAIGFGALQTLTPKAVERMYSTDIGGREKIAFADGSSVELNTNTVLRARMTTAERTIWLDKGEAYFQVKHDPAHPLVVYARGRRITDLGTDFLVRRNASTLEVALLEGRLKLGSTSARAARLLAPGDVAVATQESVLITKKTAHELANELSWRDGVLIFDNTPLSEVAVELNRYNRQKLVIADADIGQLAIVGTFRTDDVQGFTDIIHAVFKLRVRNQGQEIVISR